MNRELKTTLVAQPAIAGDGVKPGVERSGTPGFWPKNHSSPRSGRQCIVSNGCRPLPRAAVIRLPVPGVFASLHPRLYAVTRFRGLV